MNIKFMHKLICSNLNSKQAHNPNLNAAQQTRTLLKIENAKQDRSNLRKKNNWYWVWDACQTRWRGRLESWNGLRSQKDTLRSKNWKPMYIGGFRFFEIECPTSTNFKAHKTFVLQTFPSYICIVIHKLYTIWVWRNLKTKKSASSSSSSSSSSSNKTPDLRTKDIHIQ